MSRWITTLEITLSQSDTRYYSSVEVAQTSHFYEALVESWGQLTRSIPVLPGAYSVSDITIQLSNRTKEFSKALYTYNFTGKQVVIKIGVEGAALTSFATIYTGECADLSIVNGGMSAQLRIRDSSMVKLGKPASGKIDSSKFPGLESVGIEYAPIIYGTVSDADDGAVPCQYVGQDTNGAYQFVVAQHDVEVGDIFVRGGTDTIDMDVIQDVKPTSETYQWVFLTSSDASLEELIGDGSDVVVSCNATGMEESGTLITNPVQALRNYLITFCGYVSGDFDSTYYNTAYGAVASLDYVISGVIVGGNSLREIVESFCRNFSLHLFFTPAGKIAIQFSGYTSGASAPQLNHYDHIISGSFGLSINQDILNQEDVDYAFNRVRGDFLSLPSIQNTKSYGDANEYYSENLQLNLVSDADIASHVAGVRLFWSDEDRALVSLMAAASEVPSGVELAGMIRLTHPMGIHDDGTGYTDHIFKITSLGYQLGAAPKVSISGIEVEPGANSYVYYTDLPSNVTITGLTESNTNSEVTVTWTLPGTDIPEGLQVLYKSSDEAISALRYWGSLAATDETFSFTPQFRLDQQTAGLDVYLCPLLDGVSLAYADSAYSTITSGNRRRLNTITNLTATPGDAGSTRITLDWDAVTDGKYRNVWLYRGTTNVKSAATLLTTAPLSNQYIDDNAAPGVTYYYFLQALTQTGANHASDAYATVSAKIDELGNAVFHAPPAVTGFTVVVTQQSIDANGSLKAHVTLDFTAPTAIADPDSLWRSVTIYRSLVADAGNVTAGVTGSNEPKDDWVALCDITKKTTIILDPKPGVSILAAVSNGIENNVEVRGSVSAVADGGGTYTYPRARLEIPDLTVTAKVSGFTVSALNDTFTAEWGNPTGIEDAKIDSYELAYSTERGFDADVAYLVIYARPLPVTMHKVSGADPAKTYFFAIRWKSKDQIGSPWTYFGTTGCDTDASKRTPVTSYYSTGQIVNYGDRLATNNYVAGTIGFQIKADGTCEFNEVTVRGAIHASSGAITGTLGVSGAIICGDVNQVNPHIVMNAAGLAGWKGTPSVTDNLCFALATMTGDWTIGTAVYSISAGDMWARRGYIGGGSTTAQTISITPAGLQSSNFTTGSAGFVIGVDGKAEFDSVKIRVTGPVVPPVDPTDHHLLYAGDMSGDYEDDWYGNFISDSAIVGRYATASAGTINPSVFLLASKAFAGDAVHPSFAQGDFCVATNVKTAYEDPANCTSFLKFLPAAGTLDVKGTLTVIGNSFVTGDLFSGTRTSVHTQMNSFGFFGWSAADLGNGGTTANLNFGYANTNFGTVTINGQTLTINAGDFFARNGYLQGVKIGNGGLVVGDTDAGHVSISKDGVCGWKGAETVGDNISFASFTTGGTFAVGSHNYTAAAGDGWFRRGFFGGDSSGNAIEVSPTYLKTSSYVAGSAGFVLNTDGTAEFQSVKVRVSGPITPPGDPDDHHLLYAGSMAGDYEDEWYGNFISAAAIVGRRNVAGTGTVNPAVFLLASDSFAGDAIHPAFSQGDFCVADNVKTAYETPASSGAYLKFLPSAGTLAIKAAVTITGSSSVIGNLVAEGSTWATDGKIVGGSMSGYHTVMNFGGLTGWSGDDSTLTNLQFGFGTIDYGKVPLGSNLLDIKQGYFFAKGGYIGSVKFDGTGIQSIGYSASAWSASTTYAQYEMATTSSGTKVWKSKQGSNLNHTPTGVADDWWELSTKGFAINGVGTAEFSDIELRTSKGVISMVSTSGDFGINLGVPSGGSDDDATFQVLPNGDAYFNYKGSAASKTPYTVMYGDSSFSALELYTKEGVLCGAVEGWSTGASTRFGQLYMRGIVQATGAIDTEVKITPIGMTVVNNSAYQFTVDGYSATKYVDIRGEYRVNGTKVLGARGASVSDATNSSDVITQLNMLLSRCRDHGFITP